jgi:hypothetical protein
VQLEDLDQLKIPMASPEILVQEGNGTSLRQSPVEMCYKWLQLDSYVIVKEHQ